MCHTGYPLIMKYYAMSTQHRETRLKSKYYKLLCTFKQYFPNVRPRPLTNIYFFQIFQNTSHKFLRMTNKLRGFQSFKKCSVVHSIRFWRSAQHSGMRRNGRRFYFPTDTHLLMRHVCRVWLSLFSCLTKPSISIRAIYHCLNIFYLNFQNR